MQSEGQGPKSPKPPRKRDKGTKTRIDGLYALSTPGKWRLRVVLMNAGKQVSREKTVTAPTMDEAALELAKFRLKVKSAFKTSPRSGRDTKPAKELLLQDYARRWLARKLQTVAPRTAVKYRQSLEHTLPLFAGLKIGDLSHEHMVQARDFYSTLCQENGEPFATETLRNRWGVLVRMVRDAAAAAHLGFDPAWRVPSPKSKRRRVREHATLSHVDLRGLLEALPDVANESWYVANWVLAFTGMRIGELCALQWGDIDFEEGVLTIERSVSFLKAGELAANATHADWWGFTGLDHDAREHILDGGIIQVAQAVLKLPKTGEPRRVALTERTVRLLAQLRRSGDTIRAGDEIVFPIKTGDGYRRAASFRKPLRTAAELAGINIKVGAQVLRRTFNTLGRLVVEHGLVEFGVPRQLAPGVRPRRLLALQDMLGHVEEAMTERYNRTTMLERRAVVEAVERLVFEEAG